MTVINNIVTLIMVTIQNVCMSIYESIGTQLSPLFEISLTLFVVVMGIKLITRGDTDSFKKLIITAVIITITFEIAKNKDLYKEYIIGPILGTTMDLGNYILSASAEITKTKETNAFEYLSTSYSDLLTYCDNLKPSGSFINNAGLYIQVWVAKLTLFVAYLVFALCFYGYFLLAWATVYLLSIFAGIFLLMAAFPSTRSLTLAYFKTTLNSCMMMILAHAVMAVTITGINGTFKNLAGTDISAGIFTEFFLAALIVCILGIYLMTRIPEISSSLIGVMSSMGSGFAQGAASLGFRSLAAPSKGAANMTLKAGGMAGKGALNVAKGAGSVITGNATEILKRMRGI